MSQDIKNVVLAGAGGNLGPSVLSGLRSEGFTVTILSRSDGTSTFPPEVKVIKSDYSHESLVAAFKGQDAIVSAVASHAIPSQTKLIDAAIEAGVKRFVPGEFGSDTTNKTASQRVPFFAGKRAIVEYLRSKESQISWTGIVTGPFFDWGMKVGFFGVSFQNKTVTLYEPGHNQPFSVSTLPDIGVAVAKSLLPKINAETKNRYVYVRTLTTTQDEIAATLRKVSGEKWEAKSVEIDPLVESANEKLKKGDMSGVIPVLVGALLDPEAGMDFDKRGVLDNELLGMPKTTVEEACKALL